MKTFVVGTQKVHCQGTSNEYPKICFQVSSQLVFRFKRRISIQIFKMGAMGGILNFQSERFSYFFFLQVTSILPMTFQMVLQITDALVKEKKIKTDFQHGCHGSHLRFPTGMILAIFHLAQILLIKFQIKWPFGSSIKIFEIDFQHGNHAGHLGFTIGTI